MSLTTHRLATILSVAIALGIQAPVAQAQWLSQTNLLLLARNDGWQSYQSQAGGFSAQLPGPANWEIEKTDFKGYPITVHFMEIETDNDAYGIGYADLSPAYLAKGSNAVLNEIGQELLDKKMKPIPQQELHSSLRDYPGRFTQKGLFHMKMKARLHLVNKRMYFIFAASDQHQSIDRFLNSFALLK